LTTPKEINARRVMAMSISKRVKPASLDADIELYFFIMIGDKS
jgi:hypothetical protein